MQEIQHESLFLSPHFLICWVNFLLNTDLKGLESCGNGIVYGRILHRFYKDSISISKLSAEARTKSQTFNNFLILQEDMTKLQLNYVLKAEDFIDFEFLIHYHFLHWLYEHCVSKRLLHLYSLKDEIVSTNSKIVSSSTASITNSKMENSIIDCHRVISELKEYCGERISELKSLLAANDLILQDWKFYHQKLCTIRDFILDNHPEGEFSETLLEIIADEPKDFAS